MTNLSQSALRHIARSTPPTSLLAALCLLPAGAFAQTSFSVSSRSILLSQPSSGALPRPITAGDILTPPGGLPQFPTLGLVLPNPAILYGGDASNSGLAGNLEIPVSFNDCVGQSAIQNCPSDVDAISYGEDDLLSITAAFSGLNGEKSHWYFSVDVFAEGRPGLPLDPSVESENRMLVTGVRAGDSSADVFRDMGLAFPPPLGPLDPVAGNTGAIDGDGMPSRSTFFTYPGLGLEEPNLPPLPGPGDDVDAFDMGGPPFPGGSGTVYYSLASGFWDPKSMLFNNGSAVANGFVGGDVLVRDPVLGLTVYADAVELGMDQAMPDDDDLDALVVAENNVPGFQVSMTPYDWESGVSDMLLFSVRRGSRIIGALDSIFGAPIEEGDILVPPVMGGNGNPGIFIAAEILGLRTVRNFDPCGDDLDALDFDTTKTLIAHEYCYGNGGVTVGPNQCTACPCSNDIAPGELRGCMNSNGTGARLEAEGFACVTADTLRFTMTGGNPSTFGILVGGANRLPLMGVCAGAGIAQPAMLDGLRCMGGALVRNGSRATDANGDIGITNTGWGAPDGPLGGILAFQGLLSCQTRQFQVFYREDPLMVCMNGQNTSNGVQIVTMP